MAFLCTDRKSDADFPAKAGVLQGVVSLHACLWPHATAKDNRLSADMHPLLAVVALCAEVNNNIYKVKCQSNGTLPAGFNVTLTAEAGAPGCTSTVSDTSVVALAGCCGGGGDTAFATIRASRNGISPLSNGDAFCFGHKDTTWPDCSNRWGWRNEFSKAGTQTAAIIAGAAIGCKNINKVVGQMPVMCTDEGSNSRVILGVPDNFGIKPDDNHFYVGCKAWLAPSIPEKAEVTRLPATFLPRPQGNPHNQQPGHLRL
jgi:hypothetical protein